MRERRDESGMALVTVLVLLALLMTMLLGYFTLTRIEVSSARSSMNSFRGFYAAEAGLNVRAELVRQIFEGYNRPAGTSPRPGVGQVPCTDGEPGSRRLRLRALRASRTATSPTYRRGGRRRTRRRSVIPRGEPFQNLNAQEYRYAVHSAARQPQGPARGDAGDALQEPPGPAVPVRGVLQQGPGDPARSGHDPRPARYTPTATSTSAADNTPGHHRAGHRRRAISTAAARTTTLHDRAGRVADPVTRPSSRPASASGQLLYAGRCWTPGTA